jgi:hypothetical protein
MRIRVYGLLKERYFVAVLAAWWGKGIGDYHLLEKCHLDGANACVPTLPRPVHGGWPLC